MLACANLGYAYDEGEGVRVDHVKANELYKKACDGGEPLGCYNLGDLYKNGNGVKKRFEKSGAIL